MLHCYSFTSNLTFRENSWCAIIHLDLEKYNTSYFLLCDTSYCSPCYIATSVSLPLFLTPPMKWLLSVFGVLFCLINHHLSEADWHTHTYTQTERGKQFIMDHSFVILWGVDKESVLISAVCVHVCVCMRACMHACACYIDSSPFIWLIIHQVFQLDSSFILKHTHTYMRTECGHRHINLHTI